MLKMLKQMYSKRAVAVALMGVVSILLGSAPTAQADCSVIAPEGFDQRAFLGSVTSPFLTPGLTNDIKIVGAVCEQLERSSAADFQLGGVDLGADDLVITIAFVGSSAPSLLVLGADPSLCDGSTSCTVDSSTEREIAEIPLPGGGTERRLRFRVPEHLSHFGPSRLGIKLASDPQPVAFELRAASCSEAADAYVACIDEFFSLDGSCRTGDAFVSRPFSGLVAIPKTDFTDICTNGCDGLAGAGTSTSLPVSTDRDGNAIFAMVYADQLVREARFDGLIEPKPRRVSLSIDDAASHGFTDDGPPVYAQKPSSYTFEGFPLSPPFNPFVDPTLPVGEIGLWGMADAEATVHFVPRRACSDDPARACTANTECGNAGICGAAEFDFVQDASAIELPVASAEASEAFELNSWLDGSLTDAAVAIAEDERLRGEPVNSDGAADDIVVELLDRGTGLLKRLAGLFRGRGLTQVRIVDGEEDFVLPSVAAENRILAFLESEFAEGLANPLEATTGAQARAADLNANNRLDQNLRVFALSDDPRVEEARSLLADNLDLAVLADGRFDDHQNLVLTSGKLFFAYSPIQQQPHAYQLVNRSNTGAPGNSFAGESDLSSDGAFVAYVSGANNLVGQAAPAGSLVASTPGNTVLMAVTGPNGEFPVVVEGKTVFEYIATDYEMGSSPSRIYLELPLCDTATGEPDLVALVDLIETRPNARIVGDSRRKCVGCEFPGSEAITFNRGLGKGKPQTYRLVFDSPAVPAGEIGVNFKSRGKLESTAIRGPACVGAALTPNIERIYLRDIEAATTQIVSVSDRASCDDPAVATDEPSGNPHVTRGGQLVYFDSKARLTADDTDSKSDVYVYDPATCDLVNVSEGLARPQPIPAPRTMELSWRSNPEATRRSSFSTAPAVSSSKSDSDANRTCRPTARSSPTPRTLAASPRSSSSRSPTPGSARPSPSA